MVGLPCVGKTTLARRLEDELPALRLTPDEWHIRLFGLDFDLDVEHELHNSRHDLIESLLWTVAERVLALGSNVILDFGFWVRVEREDYRARAAAVGAASEIHFLDLPEQEHVARLVRRNAAVPASTFLVSEIRLKQWMAQFEAPTADELVRRG